MVTLGVLCSGGLGYQTLQKILAAYEVRFILTDKKSTEIIALAQEVQIPYYAGNPRKGRGFNAIKAIEVDVIASINYLFLIEEDIIAHPKKLIFNIHGSLLPKYRGRTPHVWAIINGETKAGVTAHEVDTGCDTGRIIHQIEVPIEQEDTGADVLKKYESLYFPLVQNVLKQVATNQLNLQEQNHEAASYFGKRVPTDGLINWNLSKDQIRNWVRAQAFPYPGAFTFYEGEKIIIDKVSVSDFAGVLSNENGEIISTEPKVTIKVKDGLVRLETIRKENSIFRVGNKFENEDRE
ncbi:MAG: methionyl-tRNA formyltransferase [Bacteroidota bacterium]